MRRFCTARTPGHRALEAQGLKPVPPRAKAWEGLGTLMRDRAAVAAGPKEDGDDLTASGSRRSDAGAGGQASGSVARRHRW